MSVLLADIDATCAALGYSDGQRYQAEPDAIQGLKVSKLLESNAEVVNLLNVFFVCTCSCVLLIASHLDFAS